MRLSLVWLLLFFLRSTTTTNAARCSSFEGVPNECDPFFGSSNVQYNYYIPDGYNVSFIEVINFVTLPL